MLKRRLWYIAYFYLPHPVRSIKRVYHYVVDVMFRKRIKRFYRLGDLSLGHDVIILDVDSKRLASAKGLAGYTVITNNMLASHFSSLTPIIVIDGVVRDGNGRIAILKEVCPPDTVIECEEVLIL